MPLNKLCSATNKTSTIFKVNLELQACLVKDDIFPIRLPLDFVPASIPKDNGGQLMFGTAKANGFLKPRKVHEPSAPDFLMGYMWNITKYTYCNIHKYIAHIMYLYFTYTWKYCIIQ